MLAERTRREMMDWAIVGARIPALHRMIVCVDVESFTDQRRTDYQRLAVRAGVYQALEDAFGRADVDLAACEHEDRGDGVFILVPPEVAPKERVVVDVLPHLAAALAKHNEVHAQGARVRLRAALHAGEVYRDEHGVAGTAANVAFRMLEARPLKDALARSSGLLAVIASDRIFEDVIRHVPGSPAASYRKTHVSARGVETDAWIGLPDDPRPPELPDERVTGAPMGPAQSAYMRQVEQIFSGELKDRDAELTELAEFCTRNDGSGYVWWQAPAWAGKSALMATLALNPPDGVRVVPFFITARWAGQSDRAAFLETVLTQLAEIVRQPLPEVLTESNRQQWFLRLLDEASESCADAGQHLVLLVDGLDEDRGVTRGPDGHSIAALLPGRPPHGLKVVVAGRPNPPVPPDIPDWHPLRRPQIVRPLEPSPHAVAVRDAAGRELASLLDGGGLGRQLLGLLVVAGGGLAGRDLAALTGEPVREIELILRTVTGRSFASRSPQWVLDGERLFALAHEELVHSVRQALRPTEIADHRETIHAWAEQHRRQGWPENTPEYLLRGYLQMLIADGDVPRMRALTTDWARLDRMLDLSGGDAAALADITTVQEHIRDQPEPDITASLH